MIHLLVPSWCRGPGTRQSQKSRGKFSWLSSFSQLQWETLRKWDFGILQLRCQTLDEMIRTAPSFFFYINFWISPLCPVQCFFPSTCTFFVFFPPPCHCCFSGFVNISPVYLIYTLSRHLKSSFIKRACNFWYQVLIFVNYVWKCL